MAIASMFTSMANWCTPTILFCLLNLMIATIFIASNFKSPNHHDHQYNTPSQLVRSPSLLERVKSINLSSFYTTPESHDQYKVYSQTTEYDSASQHSPRPSLLQRVKSIDFAFSSFRNSFHTEPDQPSNSPTEQTRKRSLSDRVKSFKLTSSFNSDQHSGYTSNSKDPVEDKNVTSGVSHQNEELVNVSEKKPTVQLQYESVDAKADDFIKRFKQQLRLQRLDSFQRLREMLNR